MVGRDSIKVIVGQMSINFLLMMTNVKETKKLKTLVDFKLIFLRYMVSSMLMYFLLRVRRSSMTSNGSL